MAKFKVGDTVHLKSDPNTMYIITKEFGSVFPTVFNDMYQIIQKDNPSIALDAKEGDIEISQKPSDDL